MVFVILIVITGSITFFNTDTPQQQKIKKSVFFDSEYDEFLLQKSQIKNPQSKYIISKCGVDGQCIVEELQNITKNDPDSDPFEIVSSLTSAFEQQQIKCHIQGHHIGKFLLGYVNADLKKALSFVSDNCGGSMFHGILGNYLERLVLLDKINPDKIDIKNLCKMFDEDWQTSLECTHGIGHGLLKIYEYDLKKATHRCDEFELDPQKFTCYRGVFMENLHAFVEKNPSSNFRTDDVFYPCNTFEGNYAKTCYTYQGSFIQRLSNSTSEAIKQCKKLSVEEMIPYCYSGIGVVNNSPISSIDDFVRDCIRPDEDFSKQCFATIVLRITDWRGWSASVEFCQKSPDIYKLICYEYLGKFAADLDKTNECSKAESLEYENICRNADPTDVRLLIT